MPVQKIVPRPGVNKEVTSYAGEGRWYDCDKVRFRQGFPEKIGGWRRLSEYTFLGVCRSIFNWVTLGSLPLWGVGTNLKYYINSGGEYYDVTPIRATSSLGTDPVTTTNTSTTVQITDIAHGAAVGDFVTLASLTGPVGGIPASDLNQEHQITNVVDADNYEIVVATAATSSTTGGGASGTAEYQINVGPDIPTPLTGWGSGGWSSGTWGTSGGTTEALRLWSQGNFGEDLIFGPRGGAIYFWDVSSGLTTRGTLLSAESGASDVPTVQNRIFISDNRFVFCFGCNALGASDLDPLLIRWSDQEDAVNWTPAATNQAGSLRLSRGNEIVSAIAARQEILVWTDSTVYSLQYLGAPEVWGQQVVGENISIVGPSVVGYANGAAFWMGQEKFYVYDGQVKTLRCDVRRYIFEDIDLSQSDQFFCGSNEGFNELWWFYCTSGSETVDRYVVYNYVEDIWYHGNLARTAWVNPFTSPFPTAATYNNKLVQHENGVDDLEDPTPAAISAYITSTQFDLEDGDKFMLVRRVLPDLSFEGSEAEAPQVTMSLLPLKNSGAGYNSPLSEGGSNNGTVTRTVSTPIEEYTEEVFVRIRGRQVAMKIESSDVGVQWQLGATRLDMRPSGRR